MKKILLIEDESSIADNIRHALGEEGFQVIWCSTGRQGQKVIEEGGILLVILDVGLPDINGFDLCRKISLPVIFLTTRTEEIEQLVCLEKDVDDYVMKPFRSRELMARVHMVLRRWKSLGFDDEELLQAQQETRRSLRGDE